MDLDDALDELYAAAPEQFVPTRARLVKALRASGANDDAAILARTRKPPVAAWALNQLSRRNRREVDLLLDAGHRLREAQTAVLRGASRDVFQRARSDEAKALGRLLDQAEAVLEERASATVLGQIRESLEAAAVSDEGRALLARGRFSAPITRHGFDLVGELAASIPRPSRRPSARDDSARVDKAKLAREELRDARARLRDAERGARKAWQLADRARAEAETAVHAAEEAEAVRDAAADEVEELESRLRQP
jgi:hypothetical protein